MSLIFQRGFPLVRTGERSSFSRAPPATEQMSNLHMSIISLIHEAHQTNSLQRDGWGRSLHESASPQLPGAQRGRSLIKSHVAVIQTGAVAGSHWPERVLRCSTWSLTFNRWLLKWANGLMGGGEEQHLLCRGSVWPASALHSTDTCSRLLWGRHECMQEDTLTWSFVCFHLLWTLDVHWKFSCQLSSRPVRQPVLFCTSSFIYFNREWSSNITNIQAQLHEAFHLLFYRSRFHSSQTQIGFTARQI